MYDMCYICMLFKFNVNKHVFTSFRKVAYYNSAPCFLHLTLYFGDHLGAIFKDFLLCFTAAETLLRESTKLCLFRYVAVSSLAFYIVVGTVCFCW